MKTIDLSNFNT
uniref:Uncharacterized protein n=1 Tax=Ignisphaera aggregans TaxID=334771 RepID=A0A7C5UWP6_9CREN